VGVQMNDLSWAGSVRARRRPEKIINIIIIVVIVVVIDRAPLVQADYSASAADKKRSVDVYVRLRSDARNSTFHIRLIVFY